MTDVGAKVAELDKTLAVHLAECTEQNKAMWSALRDLKKVIYWAAAGLIGGQFMVIAFLLAGIVKGWKL